MSDRSMSHAMQLDEAARLFRETAPTASTARFEEVLHNLVNEARWWNEVLDSTRRGSHGEWVVMPGDRHEDGRTKLAFMLEVGEVLGDW